MTTLEDIINEVYNKSQGDNKNYANILIDILKQKHMWPVIKVKKFKNNTNLCLLHNSYKRDDVSEFQELYDRCRSIVLDFSRSIGNNVVISISNSIPIRSTVENYVNSIYEQTDRCSMALDGTLITVYFHEGVWHFGSSSCPDINSSKFSNKDKTHGVMFDEILYEIYKNNVDIADPNISSVLRNLFTSQNLNPLYSYDFVLIHHENKHIIDYTSTLGANYKFLFHINTKNRITLIEENIDNQPFINNGIKYPVIYVTPQEAIVSLNYECNYGIIVKKNNKIYKISSDVILHKEDVNAYNHNKWYNILYVYMLQKPNYDVHNFIAEFYQSSEFPINTGVTINMIFNVIKKILYLLYVSTTKYYPKYNRFKIDLNMDRTLNPLIRFHLAQLRHQQTTIYKNKIITEDNVFNYLCHSNNIKNIQKLIKHFATVSGYDIMPELIIEFNGLSNLLENN
jgi:hypothetical protein